MISLALRPLNAELGQPRENLLQHAGGGVLGLYHVPLGLEQLPEDKPGQAVVEKPDYQGHRRELHAVIAHKGDAPKGEDKAENLDGQVAGQKALDFLQGLHAAGQLPGLELAEKCGREGEQPPPEGGLGGGVQMGGKAHDRHGADGGKGRHGKARHHSHLGHRGQSLPVKGGNNILENGLGDDGRHQRNQPRHKAHKQDGLPVHLPALPQHEFHQIHKLQLARRKSRIIGKGILIQPGGDFVGDGKPLGVFGCDKGIFSRPLGQNSRQGFFLCPRSGVVAQHDAAVLFVPVLRQLHQPHLHAALLGQAADKAKLIQLLDDFRGNADMVCGHGEGPGNGLHHKGGFLQRGAARPFVVENPVLFPQEQPHGLIQQFFLLTGPEGKPLGKLFVHALEFHAHHHGEDDFIFPEFLHQGLMVPRHPVKQGAVLPGQEHIVPLVCDKVEPPHIHKPHEPAAHKGAKLSRTEGGKG